MKSRVSISVVAALVLAGLACGKKEELPPPPPPTVATAAPTAIPPVAVSTVTLGNAIGEDKKVTAPAETFGPKDTIYASVETTGQGAAKLRALWTFVKGEKTAKVDETTIEVNTTAPMVNEFHVSKPSGWPAGDYKVEIFLDDAAAPAVTKTFKVG
jgi:hypothetical protein